MVFGPFAKEHGRLFAVSGLNTMKGRELRQAFKKT